MRTLSDTLTAAQAVELLHRQDSLQAEAAALLAQLGLLQHLRGIGQAELIGSAALGLMVWRDIDLLVVTPGLSVAQAFATMSPLITDPCVTQVRYRNQSGRFNETSLPEDERYFFATLYHADRAEAWTIDISFWLGDRPRREIATRDALSSTFSH